MEGPEVGTNPARSDSYTLPHTKASIARAASEGISSALSSTASVSHQESKDIRIFIADDETIVRESLELLLQSKDDFEVIGGCSDAEETLRLVLKLKPDILLLDHRLPREGAMNVLERLKESETNLKVILLCPAMTQDETIRALRSGALGILSKTEPIESLIECIHKVARDEYWLGKDGLRDLVRALCSSGNSKRSIKNSFSLTQREIEIIRAVLEGFSNPEIAARFSLSEQTIKHHLSHIFDKLGVYSRVELALFAVNHNINSE